MHSLFLASFLSLRIQHVQKACLKLWDRHKQPDPDTGNLSEKRDRERKQHIQLTVVRHILNVNIKCSGSLMRDSTSFSEEVIKNTCAGAGGMNRFQRR